MLGQLCVRVVDEEEEEDDDELGEGLLVAARAIAAPPPTRTPVRVRAAKVLRRRNRMFDHLPSDATSPSEEHGAEVALGTGKEPPPSVGVAQRFSRGDRSGLTARSQ